MTATFPFLPWLWYFSGEGEGGWLHVSLQRRGDAERGQMASRAGKERGCWGFICSRWSRFRVHSLETIGGFGQWAGDGVVVSVQCCRGEREWLPIPVANRSGSVNVR
jgi:hypothetical protein